MAARSGCSSESESDEPASRATGKSFSIETLLAKSQPSSYIRFNRNEQFLADFTPKQVCPVPANILVPGNLFRRTPRKNLSPAGHVGPFDTDTPIQPFLVGQRRNDFDQGTDGDASHATVTETENGGVDEDEDEEGDDDEHGDGALMLGVEPNTRYKKKRPRTAFSVSQIKTLEAEFERNRYLTGSKRKELSKILKLSETQIKIWFQNRRTKLKRKNVSEMESWVQQLYSPLGPMAPRPLVIGDRLYLFNNPGTDAPLPPSYYPVAPMFDNWRQGPSWS